MLYIADLARSFSIVHRKLFWGARAEILPFLGFVQKYYCPGTTPSWEPMQGHFWACAEILVSRRNIHLWVLEKTLNSGMDRDISDHSGNIGYSRSWPSISVNPIWTKLRINITVGGEETIILKFWTKLDILHQIWKHWNIIFEMSYGQSVKLQYCQIGGHM